MKCRVTKMRRTGVDLPKWSLRETAPTLGVLEVLDVRDDGAGRTVKVARLTAGIGPTRRQDTLYEPHLIWMSEGRFTLAGFERVQVNSQVVNYAQSWLCVIDSAQT
jgi:hypothetical protein